MQIFLAFFTVAIYSLPVIISGIFYVLLVHSGSKFFKNNVDVAVGPTSFEMVNTISNCNQEWNNSGSKPHPSDSENDCQINGQNEDSQSMGYETYEYNKILEECGMPFDTSIKTVKNCLGSGENESKTFQSFAKSEIFFVRTEQQNSIEIASIPILKENNSNGIQLQTFESLSILASEVPKSHPEDELEDPKPPTDFQNEDSSSNEDLKMDERSSRHLAEKNSAIKSLETNLILILVFCLSNLFFLIPSKMLQTYFCVVATSVLRALLPIVTTMTNFGTIRLVAIQFWDILTDN